MPSRGITFFAVLTALATLCLVGVGGLVTSHGVGMAVPDWPNTYGYNMFFFPFSQWVGGVFYEHSHRLVASGVGLMTTILALWLHGRPARTVTRWGGIVLLLAGVVSLVAYPARRQDGIVLVIVGAVSLGSSLVWPRAEPASKWLRRLGVIAFAAVVLQGVLGGLRVTAMKDQIGIFHAALAQLFLALVCAIALFTTRWWANLKFSKPYVPGPLLNLFALTTVVILGQLVLGATMRHAHAGLAIQDFPLAHGRLWPDTRPAAIERYNQERLEVTAANPITRSQVILQMVHRIVAVAILLLVAASAWKSSRNLPPGNAVTRISWVWAVLIAVQVVLGAATIWSNKAADIATLHVLVGSLSLATGAILCVISRRVLTPAVGKAGRNFAWAPGSWRLGPQTSTGSNL